MSQSMMSQIHHGHKIVIECVSGGSGFKVATEHSFVRAWRIFFAGKTLRNLILDPLTSTAVRHAQLQFAREFYLSPINPITLKTLAHSPPRWGHLQRDH